MELETETTEVKSPKETACQAESNSSEDRPSSPIDCAICLEQLTDKSFTNSCFHMFCFHCLLAWSKVKPECPLCKQDFCSIIHNIRSMDDYDEYRIPPSELRFAAPPSSNPFLHSTFSRHHHPNYLAQGPNFFSNNRDFFSYRTTFMPEGFSVPRERSSSLVIQPYVDNLQIQNDFSMLNPAQPSCVRFNRKDVYQKELDVRPPVVGRYRECSPTFYRENEGQMHRLGRWLSRELVAISQVGIRFNPDDVLSLIMSMLPTYEIQGSMFRSAIFPYLGVHTTRFMREFYNFAVSPYEIDQYDRECTYVRQRSGSRLSFIVTVGGGDDTEDVQVIPNRPLNPSVRPWIDINDLNAPRYNSIYPSSSSGASADSHHHVRGISSLLSGTSSTPWRWHSHAALSSPAATINRLSAAAAAAAAASTSYQVIDISDSENDDCVIIDEVRTAPETIVLDDSDYEHMPTSPACAPPLSSSSCCLVAHHQRYSAAAAAAATSASEYNITPLDLSVIAMEPFSEPKPSTSTATYGGHESTSAGGAYKKEPSIIESDSSLSRLDMRRNLLLSRRKRSRSNSSVLSTDNSIIEEREDEEGGARNGVDGANVEESRRPVKVSKRRSKKSSGNGGGRGGGGGSSSSNNTRAATAQDSSPTRKGTGFIRFWCSSSDEVVVSDKEDGDWLRESRYKKKKKKLRKHKEKGGSEDGRAGGSNSSKKETKKRKKCSKERKSSSKKRKSAVAPSETDTDECCKLPPKQRHKRRPPMTRSTSQKSSMVAGSVEGGAEAAAATAEVKSSVNSVHSGLPRLRSVLRKINPPSPPPSLSYSFVGSQKYSMKYSSPSENEEEAVPSTSYGFRGFRNSKSYSYLLHNGLSSDSEIN